jgi:predicted ester cyclase
VSVEANKATVRRWVEEAWNHGDFSSAETLYTPTYSLHNPNQDFPSIEALKGFITGLRAACPDLHMTVEDTLGEGDQIAWRFTVTGTHTGAPFMGAAAAGKPIRNAGLLITRFENGKWAEDQCHWDVLGMLQQLGIIPVMA